MPHTRESLPSEWQLGDKVQVVFPGNGKLQGTISKVSFTEYTEPLYDVDIPFSHHDYEGEPELNKPVKNAYFRIHGLRQWFISYTQEEWDEMQKDETNIKSKRKDPTNYRLA